jgi:hypothetical protein
VPLSMMRLSTGAAWSMCESAWTSTGAAVSASRAIAIVANRRFIEILLGSVAGEVLQFTSRASIDEMSLENRCASYRRSGAVSTAAIAEISAVPDGPRRPALDRWFQIR